MTWRHSNDISQSGKTSLPKGAPSRKAMFEIDSAATAYIRKRCQGAVTIVLDFQPMMGGG